MDTQDNAILDSVIAMIRSTIDEDWIMDFHIDADTRFNSDLEIESIEFVKIADAIQRHFGTRLDIVGWLAGKNIHELIALSVGELAGYVANALHEVA
jgi:acyl carrier protein